MGGFRGLQPSIGHFDQPKSCGEAVTQVVFRVFDIFWCASFLLELALRVIADGSHFLDTRNPESLGVEGQLAAAWDVGISPTALVHRSQVHVERHRYISGGTSAAAVQGKFQTQQWHIVACSRRDSPVQKR
eukprot:Skav200373  [mRNA]  locus=scaffold2518:302687:303079:- [translate_table: standard]